MAARDQADAGLVGTTVDGEAVAVSDGDTLTLELADGRSFSVRIHGVDAPEIDQVCTSGRRRRECGVDALVFLGEWIHEKRISCTLLEIDRFRRFVARCERDGRDIGATLVREGHAVAYRYFSEDYIKSEQAARGERLGIWRGTMETPSCHRNGNSRPGCPCPIDRCTYLGR